MGNTILDTIEALQSQKERLDTRMTGLHRAINHVTDAGQAMRAAHAIATLESEAAYAVAEHALALTVTQTKAANVAACMPKLAAMANEVLSSTTVAARTMSNVFAAGTYHLMKSRNDALGEWAQMHERGEISDHDYRFLCSVTLQDTTNEIEGLMRRKAMAGHAMNQAAESAFNHFDLISKTIKGA